MQKSLDRDRVRLGLTIGAPLQNAPPLLAFTTVALGGFRGLISNLLWIRANDLQKDDKYFEAAQLAEWITDLEPHFAQVWVYQAWNMAYNISVKFKENEPAIIRPLALGASAASNCCATAALLYNPNNALIYLQLGQFFAAQDGTEPGRREHLLQATVGRGHDAVFRRKRDEF